jgi:hypothetical protein
MSNMVDRLAKILNQAERAEEGSPEREAFMERAMALSQAHSIDLAVARAHTVKKERLEVPEKRDFKVGQFSGRGAEQKNAHFVDLMIAICDANDIEVTISGSRTFVFGHGMPSDLDMAERFFALLSVQMVQEADAGLKRGDNGEWVDDAIKMQRVEIPEDERAWGEHDGSDYYTNSCYYDDFDEDLREYGGQMCRSRYNDQTGYHEWVKSYPPPRFKNVPVLDENGDPVRERKFVSKVDGRVWRANFYQGFINRTRYRLREAKQAALREAGIDVKDDSDSRTLALRDKAKEVRDFFEEEAKFVLSTGGTYGGAQVNSYSHTGQMHGDQAGQRAVLGNEKDLD